jgi:hypothetical protein
MRNEGDNRHCSSTNGYRTDRQVLSIRKLKQLIKYLLISRQVREDGGERQLLRPNIAAQQTMCSGRLYVEATWGSRSCMTFSFDVLPSLGGTLVRRKGDFPSGLVDGEEGETDYYEPRLQLNKQARSWSLRMFKCLCNLSVGVCYDHQDPIAGGCWSR